MIRLTFWIGALSPSLVQIVHVAVEEGLSQLLVD